MEWNMCVYDIANVGDVYELSLFMQNLVQCAQELCKKFVKEYLPAFLERVREGPNILKQWSMCSWISKDEKEKRFGRATKDHWQDIEKEQTI